jgi:predicted HAD superfamily Cof-like phosphohydrolase
MFDILNCLFLFGFFLILYFRKPGTAAVVIHQQTAMMRVKEWTKECGRTVPDRPVRMSAVQADFIAQMVMDELAELLCTVYDPFIVRGALKEMAGRASVPSRTALGLMQSSGHTDDLAVIAEQMDALVDIQYYLYDAASKHGFNLDPVFDEVHRANLSKRDPDTGKFLVRESDGKIIKPKGYKEADIVSIAKKLVEKGSWAC